MMVISTRRGNCNQDLEPSGGGNTVRTRLRSLSGPETGRPLLLLPELLCWERSSTLKDLWGGRVRMSSYQSEFPSTIQVECANCGHLNPLGLRYVENGVADYEGVCENELEAGGHCGAASLVTVTRPEEIEKGESAGL